MGINTANILQKILLRLGNKRTRFSFVSLLTVGLSHLFPSSFFTHFLKKPYSFLILFGLYLAPHLPINCSAQDPRFAQFYTAPDQLNPALNVVYDGRMRLILNYRDQWASVLGNTPFRTFAAHYDYRFRVAANDYMSIGLSGLQDEAGTARLKRTNGHLSLAYMKYLGGSKEKDFYLVAGAQTGIGQNSIDWSDLWFSEQYDIANETIDFGAASGENENQTGRVYPDFNAGLLWYVLGDDFSFYVGGALYHLNTPNISLFDGGIDRLQRRYVGHLGGTFQLNKFVSVLPAAAIFFQGPAVDVNIGANLRYTSGELNDLALRIGGWAHITDNTSGTDFEGFTITTMLEMTTWMLGLSYDINTSQLSPATNNKGAFEASFTYIIPAKNKRRAKVNCPKF